MKSNASTVFSGDGDEVFHQYGAVCWRIVAGQVQVLLITSRDTGRWVIPKGWPIKDLAPEACAAREAIEEAGVTGDVSSRCLGFYSYDKALVRVPGQEESLPCVVAVYPIRVTKLLSNFPEKGQRRRKWFTPEKASRRVLEPELQALLARFSPEPTPFAGQSA